MELLAFIARNDSTNIKR